MDTDRKLNIHKTFRRRPGRHLNVLCTFNLRPVSTGVFLTITALKTFENSFIIHLENIIFQYYPVGVNQVYYVQASLLQLVWRLTLSVRGCIPESISGESHMTLFMRLSIEPTYQRVSSM